MTETIKTMNAKERKQEYNRAYYLKNKEKAKSDARSYYWENKDSVLNQKKVYRLENSDKIRAKKREYYLNNLDECAAKAAAHYERNKEKIIARASERIRLMLSTDPIFRRLSIYRKRLRSALHGANILPKTSIRLFGCDMINFRNHIESMFKDGMSWENYGQGGWHIDHIKPCSAFNLNLDSEWSKCFHYSNLQPLWPRENQKKSNKYTELQPTK